MRINFLLILKNFLRSNLFKVKKNLSFFYFYFLRIHFLDLEDFGETLE
jgi:hypothetical protein